MSFIDAHHGELGIEPICREPAVAPSSWHEHAARLADPGRRSVRARRDDEIMEQMALFAPSHRRSAGRPQWRSFTSIRTPLLDTHRNLLCRSVATTD